MDIVSYKFVLLLKHKPKTHEDPKAAEIYAKGFPVSLQLPVVQLLNDRNVLILSVFRACLAIKGF